MSSRRRGDELKYGSGAGPRFGPESKPLTGLEFVTLAHTAVFGIAAAWVVGKRAESAPVALAWWGSLGLLIALTALQNRSAWQAGWMRPLRWIWPIVGFNALVLAGTLNPSFPEVSPEVGLAPSAHVGWPSSARPTIALHRLWLFDAMWITCFNIVLVIRQRRALRGLLLLLAANAVALAVFGMVQKLAGAEGFFFGAISSPQTNFFATFVHPNQWGAFTVLILAACVGLTGHYVRRIKARDVLHSPGLAGLVAMVIMGATVILSGSRSCYVLVGFLLMAAFVHWVANLVQKRRRFHESVALPLVAAGVAIVLFGAGAWFVAGKFLVVQASGTDAPLNADNSTGETRAIQQEDTWAMAKEKLWFGWGMGSYPHVFPKYNRQNPAERPPAFSEQVHNDWLQAIAEHGLAGSALLVAGAFLPLVGLRRQGATGAIPRYLLIGCGLVAGLAWFRFPFDNVVVVFHWWLWLFAAAHYGGLSRQDSRVTPMKEESPPGQLPPHAAIGRSGEE